MENLDLEEMERKQILMSEYYNISDNLNSRIGDEEIDDILFALVEYNSRIPRIIRDVKSNRKTCNVIEFLSEIDEYTRKYGKKELLAYLFRIGAIYLVSFSTACKSKDFIRNDFRNIQWQEDQIILFMSSLDHILNSKDDGIISFNPGILEDVETVKYRKTKSLYSIQNKLDSQIENLEKKLNNFNKDIISISSIILAIVPIIGINANNAKDFTLTSALAVNGCLVLAITTVYYLLAVTILEKKWNSIWPMIFPCIIAIGMIYFSIVQG